VQAASLDASRRQLSVTFFIHTPKDPKTAVFSSACRRSEELNSHNIRTDIVAPEDFPWLRKIGGRWYTLVYAFAVASYLIRRRGEVSVAVFHSHSGWVFHFIRNWFNALKGIRTATEFHGLEPLSFEQLSLEKPLSLRFRIMQGMVAKILIRESCRRSDRVHCLNSFERDYLIAHKWAKPNLVAQYANGVPEAFFQEHRNYSSASRLLFLGQWVERKGVSALVQSFTQLHRADGRIQLWCVGTLLESDSVLEQFPIDVRNGVHVISRVAHSEVRNHLRASDVFVFPTRFEGFSIALLEAMAVGLPIVTTPVGSAQDILANDVSALFVPVNDAKTLTKAIERIQSDPSLRERLGKAAQVRARGFTLDNTNSKYRGLILSIPGVQ
jgi:glycosyltransferase involved in cell wall biosynthesis